MSDIYRLTKPEVNKLNKLLEAAMDHLNEHGVVVPEKEAEDAKRSGRPHFGKYVNGADDAKIAEEIRTWSGHDRIKVDHVANQRRALFGSMYKSPTEKRKYYTTASEQLENFKDDVTRRFLSVHDCFEKLEMQVKEIGLRVGKLELADKHNTRR